MVVVNDCPEFTGIAITLLIGFIILGITTITISNDNVTIASSVCSEKFNTQYGYYMLGTLHCQKAIEINQTLSYGNIKVKIDGWYNHNAGDWSP